VPPQMASLREITVSLLLPHCCLNCDSEANIFAYHDRILQGKEKKPINDGAVSETMIDICISTLKSYRRCLFNIESNSR
jgi:hypothetical protein